MSAIANLVGIRNDRCTRGYEVVTDRGPHPRGGLHHDVVPVGDQFAHALGRRRHAELVVLDFLRDPDLHALALLSSVTPAQA
jgi:hypothetical protein